MKKILFGLLATVLLTLGAQAQKVGEIKDGKLTITEDLSFLKERWDKFLIANKIEGEIGNFELLSDTYLDEKENKVTYYLITGNTKDNLTKIADLLILDKEKLSLSLDISHSTCTCTGCYMGCHPRKYKGLVWYCANGCPACTKTETASD